MNRIIIFILLIYGYSLGAQTVKVKDKTTLQGIEGVRVNGVLTDASGNADMEKIAAWNKDSLVFFVKAGYFSDSMPLKELRKGGYMVLMTERSRDWGGIVISASRFEEKTTDVAQQNLVLDKRNIQFMNQPTTAELIQQSGRAFVQKSQVGGGSITMRGFEANRVLLVVDGVRMNNAIYRGGHLQNVLTVDNSQLERTEMLFGPGSVIYGSDALGGVVHFYTRNPVLSGSDKMLFRSMAFTRLGTATGERTAHADFNVGFKKIAFLTSLTYSDFGDLIIGKKGTKGYERWGRKTFTVQRFGNTDSMVVNADSFRQTPSGYSQWDLLQKVLFRQSRAVSHTLNLQYSGSGNIPRYDRLQELNAAGLPRQAEWYYGPQIRGMLSYQIRIDKKTRAFERSQIVAAFQQIRESRHTRGFRSSSLSHRTERVKVFTVNADFQKDIGSKTELRYGFEWTDNRVSSEAYRENILTGEVGPLDTRYPDGGSVMRSAAVFVTQNSYLTERLILNAGIRITGVYLRSEFNDRTFYPFLSGSIEQRNQNTSGSIGLVYNGPHRFRAAGTLASGFRAPNVDDMGKVFESTRGRVIIPNAGLRPESTTGIDVTLNKTFLKDLDLELNAYYTELTNALTLGVAQLNGNDSIDFGGVRSRVYTTVNAQSAYIYGTYAGFSLDIRKNLSFSAGVNYTYGRIRTDSGATPLDHISPVYGKAGVTYKHRKWKAEFVTLFNGAKKSADYRLMSEDNEEYSADPVRGFTPSWQIFIIRGQYQLTKMLQIQAAAENLLDVHYRTFSSGSSGPGRNFILTLRGQF